MQPKFQKGQKVRIVSRAAALKKYSRETGEIIDYGHAKAETVTGVAKGIPPDTDLLIYQVRRDKNGFLVSIPESALAEVKTKAKVKAK
ncbi:MAG: hypothetical protein Q8Q07_06090 [Dehalococcoidales bacterium]|nr:hypothetical protein [Dehalococcoidales bacterium]